MEDLKHEHCEQAAIYEEQIRKFRELIQDREKENGYLQTKLKQQQMVMAEACAFSLFHFFSFLLCFRFFFVFASSFFSYLVSFLI